MFYSFVKDLTSFLSMTRRYIKYYIIILLLNDLCIGLRFPYQTKCRYLIFMYLICIWFFFWRTWLTKLKQENIWREGVWKKNLYLLGFFLRWIHFTFKIVYSIIFERGEDLNHKNSLYQPLMLELDGFRF